MIDSHPFLPSPTAFAGAMDVRVGSGLPRHGLTGTAHRLAPSPLAWALRPNGRRISQ